MIKKFIKQSIMKKPHLFICFLFFLLSCNKKDTENVSIGQILTIDTEQESLKTDKPALTNISFVKLETTDSCLLEDVTKVVPFENKLYILSIPGNGNIMVFDMQGKFLYKFTKGEGPTDLLYPTDFTIDEDKKTIYILDSYRNIKEYDTEGRFIKKTVMKEPFFNIESIGNDFLLFDPNSRSQAECYLQYLSENGDKIDLFPKIAKGGFFSLPNFFTKQDDNVLVSCIFSNTIYLINHENKELVPFLVLDFKSKNANTKERLEDIQGLGAYIKFATENNYVTGPCDLSVINSNLFFSLNGKNYYFVTYNSKEQSSTLHTKLIEGLPNIYGSVGRTNKEIIYSIDMPWLMEHFKKNEVIKSEVIQQLKDICNNDSDNPVIILGSF